MTKQTSPFWTLPAGLASVTIGFAAFYASTVVGRGGTPAARLLEGLLNPLFFIGVPFGCYWLYHHIRYTPVPSQTAEDGNSKLTHCPDCGQHVSRLAKMCPHCGRPMEGG